MRRKALRRTLCLAAAAVMLGCASAERSEIRYFENEWNYADQSMDVSRGIPEEASGTLAQIQRRGTLRVAVDPEAAPAVLADPQAGPEDRFSGPDILLARRIAERMGVELKLVPLESTQILPSLTEEQCDLTISAIAFTPARALTYTLSKGYYTPEEPDRIGLLIREGSGIASPADLENRTLTAQSNSLPEAWGGRHVTRFREFRRTASAQEVFTAVASGKADAGLVMISTARNYLQNNPESGLTLAEGFSALPDAQYLGYRVAARKGETDLICFVNGVIDEILAEGSYAGWMADSVRQVGNP